MKRFFFLSFSIVVFTLLGFILQTHAQDEATAFSAASKITDLSLRIQAIEKHLTQYPESPNAQQSRYLLLEAASKLKRSDDALRFALEYVNKSTSQFNAYNTIASSFAENEINLDSALVFINRALEGYQQARGRKSPSFLDTKAFILYKQKGYNSALAAQREAIGIFPKGSEWDPDYSDIYYRLGLYMIKAGSVDSGKQLLARNVLFGSTEALDALNQFLKETNSESQFQTIFKSASNEYLSAAEDSNDAKAIVSIGFVKQNILIDDALVFARQAYEAMNANPPLEQRINRTTALGIANYAKNNFDKAIELLKSVQPFASPYSTDLFLFFGKSYEAIGKLPEAVDAYLLGAMAFQPKELMERLNTLVPVVYGKNSSVDTLLAFTINKLENFDVEPFSRSTKSDKVVLAELFTGSECKPCLAADVAYDKLIERFDRTTLAILEYHLHIPAPDPMTNKDAEARAKYYGVTSTPTSIINGTDRAIGGGPKLAAKNRFDIFSASIEAKLTEIPHADIQLDGKLVNNNVTVKAKATTSETSQMSLHVALAEDMVHYRGVNTVAEHRFVVRKLITPSSGVALNNGTASFEETVNISLLSDSLKSYLDAFEAKTPSKKAFKEKKYEINAAKLCLVAFVQDEKTKEISQAVFSSINGIGNQKKK